MRKLIMAEFLTLDGVMEASEEWQPSYVSEDVAEAIQTSILTSDAALLGRVTYQMFAAYWPRAQAAARWGHPTERQRHPRPNADAGWPGGRVLAAPSSAGARARETSLCRRDRAGWSEAH